MDNIQDLIFVSSNLELATLAFGWHMYDQLWQLMLDTGLAFLPFLGMLINNFVQPITATYTTSAAQLSLKKVEWDLIQMLIIIVLAGQPSMDLKMEKYRRLDLCQSDGKGGFLDYQKAKENSTKEANKEKSITTEKLPPPKVPLWWYAVQSFSTGFTEAAKASVPCAQDARGMLSDMISGTMVENTSLAREIEDFIEKCYLPTKSFIDLDIKAGSKSSSTFDRVKYAEFRKTYILTGAIAEVGGSGLLIDDLNYIGSRVFNAMGEREPRTQDGKVGACKILGCENFYGRTVKILGWEKGKPTETVDVSCREWWGGQEDESSSVNGKLWDVGQFIEEKYKPWLAKQTPNAIAKDYPEKEVNFETLRKLKYRMFLASKAGDILVLKMKNTSLLDISDISLSLITVNSSSDFKLGGRHLTNLELISRMNWLSSNLRTKLTEMRHQIIEGTIASYVKTNIIENLQNLPQTKESSFWKRGAAGIGLLMASLGTYATAYIARESFPHIQALLLMAMCMFMGIGLVFSGYTLQFLYAGSLGIFTLKFMGFILYFCHWIDNNLIVFLSGQKGMSGEGAWTNLWGVVNAVYTDRGFSRLILDYSIAGIYFSFPSLFATVMVWAGVRGAEVIGEAEKASNPLQQAAQHGAQQVQRVVTQLASAVGEKIPGIGHAIRFAQGKPVFKPKP